jgi:predicted CXXCH cytochrome family protein
VGDWKAWEFDHDKQTDFELTGKHKGIQCTACHREPVSFEKGAEMDMPNDCLGCHREDDAHDGEFGRRCQRCHNTEAFDEVRMR